MAAEQSPEQRELTLVGKVEMRIALADTDEKLTSILKTYLAPLLLKLSSDHQAVRNKVITVCQHVNTRVQPQSIQLPIAALVKQFKEQESSLIRHFDLLYIEQGVDRLSLAEKTELLPIVIKGISHSGNQAPRIFNLFLRLLESFTLPPRGSREDTDLRSRFEVSDADASYLATYIGKLMLFTPLKGTKRQSPGLSEVDDSFFTLQDKENVWHPSGGGLNLIRTKVLGAKLLASGLFNDQERFLPALFASADTASTISDVGEEMLKRALPSTDLESEALISRLYELYFGSEAIPRVRAPLRLKILGLLTKSTKSTMFADRITQLVDDGIASAPVMDGEDVLMSNGASSNTTVGREATKLRSAIFTYINFVARYGSKETLFAIAPQVVNRLRDFVENQGWPKPGANEDMVSRGYAYEVIGLLARSGPRSVLMEPEHPNFDLLRWLFNSLAKDTSSTIVSVEESLSAVLVALSRLELSSLEQTVLEDLLLEEIEASADQAGNRRVRSTRYVTIRFANRCLPYNSVKARQVDILGLGAKDDRAEVREEAERGLSPYWYRMLNGATGATSAADLAFPSFDAAADQFFSLKGSNHDFEPFTIVRRYASDLPEITAFLRRTLLHQAMQKAGVAVNIDTEWERKLDVAVDADVNARQAIKDFMLDAMEIHGDRLRLFQAALFDLVIASPNNVDQRFVQFLSLAPESLCRELVDHTNSLLPVLRSNNHARRLEAGRAFGILASHPSVKAGEVASQLQKLATTAQAWQSAVGTASNHCHGAIVALGYYFSRAAYRGTNVHDGIYIEDNLRAALSVITESRDDLLKEAGYVFLGQLCLYVALSSETLEKVGKIRTLVDKIYAAAKEGNEKAVLCLGQLSMIIPEKAGKEGSDLRYIDEQLHKLHEIRQAEAHFAVGEAFSYLACGWQSTALATELDVQGPTPQSPPRAQTLAHLLERILGDCENTKPSLKKAAAMWLLCLLQFCGAQQEIQDRLPKIQAAFKRCLVDRDELVQETASRGLGLVYEKGDRKLKDDLVRDLVSSFSSDRTSQLAGSVSADTQLFEPGALPTGDGSVSTYKDIMSLASEVGDSSLVYRFMSMASSNAIWSSRAAFGRFGLSNVLSDSSAEGYLANNPKLYTKLFRYRFDPNTGVRRSMNDIWNALVKDTSATVDAHFESIMEDLLTNILGKEWRVRQASCAAIADLISWPLEKYEQYLERIWTQCFKVLDDIKESVRAAAASLARTLTGALTKTLEADHSSAKNAAAMLKHVLPFLLSPSGMESSAKEVQTFSVQTLLEIIKKSNADTLRPFIPDLVDRLIGLLSSLEPEAVNYIHLNASKYNLTEQKIDDMRLSSVRMSPLMEAIERCLDLLDHETMVNLQPRLESAMKNAVGLPSKVGSSRVLVSLSTRRMALFKPFSDDFLKLVEKLVLDRNETVCSSYAVAAGYIARSASDKQLLRLIAFCKRLYFESEGDREASIPRRSISSGEVMYAVSKHASDRFNALASSALPFVFVAKHDSHEQVKEQFQNTWNESVGGSRAVLLYLTEILQLCTTYLDSAQWTLKHTSARAVVDATTVVSAMETTMSQKTAEQLWPAIEKGLSGKTWEGKEAVLFAFVKFVEKGEAFYLRRDDVKSAITKIAIREAKRQNVGYRQHAMKALGQVARARIDVDMSAAVLDVAASSLSESDHDSAMEVDGEDSRKSNDMLQKTQAAAVESVFASINPSILAKDGLEDALANGLRNVRSMHSPVVLVRKSIYDGLFDVFERIGKEGKGKPLNLDASALKSLLFGPEETIEAMRLKRESAIKAIRTASPSLIESAEANGALEGRG